MKSGMRFIKSSLEYRHIDEIPFLSDGLRGIYALYQKTGASYELVYVGMSGRDATGRIKGRLKRHKRIKNESWTHFSYYEVWDNITELEIRELEGLFRHFCRFASGANLLNLQQTYKPLTALRKSTEKEVGLPAINRKRLGV